MMEHEENFNDGFDSDGEVGPFNDAVEEEEQQKKKFEKVTSSQNYLIPNLWFSNKKPTKKLGLGFSKTIPNMRCGKKIIILL